MKKTNLLLPILIISLTILSAFAAVEDIEKCDSFSNRKSLDKLVPMNQVAQDVPAGNTSRKSIDELIQKHLENAVNAFNENLKKPENMTKYSGQCNKVNGARVRGETTQLERDFAKTVQQEMTQVEYLTSLHNEIFNNGNFSTQQYISQKNNIYSNQDEGFLKKGISFLSGKAQEDKTLAFLIERNEHLTPSGKNSKGSPTVRKYVICGDKLTSFFRHGYSLYQQSPSGNENAATSAVNRNTQGDRETNKVDIHYGKAAAEFSGLIFYRDLLHPQRGFVSCNEKGLQINSKKAFQLERFANSMWDESLNCTHFGSEKSSKMNASITNTLDKSGIKASCPIAGVQASSVLLANHCKESFESISPNKFQDICSALINPSIGDISSDRRSLIQSHSQQGTAK